jgi:hypothetical protein
MTYQTPRITDFGSIAANTFTRCASGNPVPGAPPKDFIDFPLDTHGECSSGHAVS